MKVRVVGALLLQIIIFICRVIFFIVIFVVFLANGIFQIFVQLYAACFNLTQIPSLLVRLSGVLLQINNDYLLMDNGLFLG